MYYIFRFAWRAKQHAKQFRNWASILLNIASSCTNMGQSSVGSSWNDLYTKGLPFFTFQSKPIRNCPVWKSWSEVFHHSCFILQKRTEKLVGVSGELVGKGRCFQSFRPTLNYPLNFPVKAVCNYVRFSRERGTISGQFLTTFKDRRNDQKERRKTGTGYFREKIDRW